MDSEKFLDFLIKRGATISLEDDYYIFIFNGLFIIYKKFQNGLRVSLLETNDFSKFLDYLEQL